MNYKPVWQEFFKSFMWFEGDDKKEPHRIPHTIFRYLSGYSQQGYCWVGYNTEALALRDLQLATEKAKA